MVGTTLSIPFKQFAARGTALKQHSLHPLQLIAVASRKLCLAINIKEQLQRHIIKAHSHLAATESALIGEPMSPAG